MKITENYRRACIVSGLEKVHAKQFVKIDASQIWEKPHRIIAFASDSSRANIVALCEGIIFLFNVPILSIDMEIPAIMPFIHFRPKAFSITPKRSSDSILMDTFEISVLNEIEAQVEIEAEYRCSEDDGGAYHRDSIPYKNLSQVWDRESQYFFLSPAHRSVDYKTFRIATLGEIDKPFLVLYDDDNVFLLGVQASTISMHKNDLLFYPTAFHASFVDDNGFVTVEITLK